MASEAPQIPKQHKAVVYDKPGAISTKVVWVDTPEPGPGEVLVNLYVWLLMVTTKELGTCQTVDLLSIGGDVLYSMVVTD
jgi:hypothetical protein